AARRACDRRLVRVRRKRRGPSTKRRGGLPRGRERRERGRRRRAVDRRARRSLDRAAGGGRAASRRRWPGGGGAMTHGESSLVWAFLLLGCGFAILLACRDTRRRLIGIELGVV